MLIAHIALPVRLPQLFDYLVPEQLVDQLQIGMRVKVPFGRRQIIGIVVAIDTTSQYDSDKLKAIDEQIDQQALLPNSIWHLLLWAAQYYHYPLGEVLFHGLPVLLRQGHQTTIDVEYYWQFTQQGQQFDSNLLSRSPKQKQLFTYLQTQSLLSKHNQLDFSAAVYKSLVQRNLITQVAIKPDVQEWRENFSINESGIQLNQQQQQAISCINQQNQQFAIYLLDGVTGSGKTEVYLTVLADVLKQGKQGLVLVPEIGLTPQTITRFKQRFNAPIDILHSGLSDKERLAVWLRSKNGENAIVVGTRSALFTPFKQLGMIIIDEEHDNSYKQQEGWRYHGRDLAIVRGKLDNIPVILGSATPSLETINNAITGKYQHLALTERAGNAAFAKQRILDLKGLHLTAGLSQPLIEQIKLHLAANNQVMLFLNRRGFAPLIVCHDCGWIAECPRCDRAYTYHQKQHRLICHHCDSQRHIPNQCPKCGSTHLLPIGVGTEQLEKQLQQTFANIPISRIDRDSISKKGVLETHLAQIQQGGAHLLVGTQILAKGHHFPDVTLVGIIDVDGALFSTDFRATERFAQIYTQVSGRAGRENKAGEVILQTYHPTHPLLVTLLQEGYQSFAKQTLHERQLTLLPPFSYQALIRAADRNNQYAPAFLQKIYAWVKQHFAQQAFWLLAPLPASHAKKAGYYRWQLLIQHNNRQLLQTLLQELTAEISLWPEAKNLKWNIDVDPIESY